MKKWKLAYSVLFFGVCLTPLYLVTAAVGIVACCPVKMLVKKGRAYEAVTAAGSLALLLLCMLSLASGTYNPFIYFRF